jgi:hypothetical protein
MNDINVCCLRFFVAEGAVNGEGALAGRVRGPLTAGGTPAGRTVRVRENGAGSGQARNGAAAWPFGETLETGMPANISGIHNGEHWQLVAA